MTREEIIEMARSAGLRTGHISLSIGEPIPFVAPASATDCLVEIERFAAMVAAKEREACAQVCDEQQKRSAESMSAAKHMKTRSIYSSAAQTARWNAAAIRNRSNT